ncbi:hypothetical protein [Bradyrhizobium vignae]|uniref:Uncharacterized protein n=1 Tax=Bradyrhizobium vignae TaxID=1549949 RepID=A0ABS3ZWQ3_9BRAD|nr:hypothetical protein [Bradyrhizobium vignae]MBP0112200.1 hypothetical protein [Bradyrhizobium vignae]
MQMTVAFAGAAVRKVKIAILIRTHPDFTDSRKSSQVILPAVDGSTS